MPGSALRSRPVLLFAIACLTVLTGPPSAPEHFGDNTGTVTDPSKAVLTGVRVNIRNDGTGLTRSSPRPGKLQRRSARGQCSLSRAQGFRKKAATGITLQVDQTAR
jgi:hypothetical protein